MLYTQCGDIAVSGCNSITFENYLINYISEDAPDINGFNRNKKLTWGTRSLLIGVKINRRSLYGREVDNEGQGDMQRPLKEGGGGMYCREFLEKESGTLGIVGENGKMKKAPDVCNELGLKEQQSVQSLVIYYWSIFRDWALSEELVFRTAGLRRLWNWCTGWQCRLFYICFPIFLNVGKRYLFHWILNKLNNFNKTQHMEGITWVVVVLFLCSWCAQYIKYIIALP